MSGQRRPMGSLEDHVMDYLWALGSSASAADVRSAVAPELAYTTVTTVLTRLVEKGRLERHLVGRSFRYEPTRPEAEVRAEEMSGALGDAGDRTAVLSRFVDALPADDLLTLRRLLEGGD